MPDTIRDGAGTGYLAKVNANQRLYTQSVAINENLEATKRGASYNINTGVITLTNDDETPILYVKNNETQDLHITAIAIGIGITDGTATIPKITIIRNPTAGTITSGSNIDINSNRNYSSSNTLSVTAKKGATGSTMTDGDDHIIFFQTEKGRLFATIDEILGTGSSIGIKFDPQTTSNTSLDLYAALICHLEDENE